jgi:hypothetical protein
MNKKIQSLLLDEQIEKAKDEGSNLVPMKVALESELQNLIDANKELKPMHMPPELRIKRIAARVDRRVTMPPKKALQEGVEVRKQRSKTMMPVTGKM